MARWTRANHLKNNDPLKLTMFQRFKNTETRLAQNIAKIINPRHKLHSLDSTRPNRHRKQLSAKTSELDEKGAQKSRRLGP